MKKSINEKRYKELDKKMQEYRSNKVPLLSLEETIEWGNLRVDKHFKYLKKEKIKRQIKIVLIIIVFIILIYYFI